MTSALIVPGVKYRARADGSELYCDGYPAIPRTPPVFTTPRAALLYTQMAVSVDTPPPGGNLRPAPGTYPRQYRYEDVYVSGDTLQQTFTRAAALSALNVVLTMPDDEFTWSDFTQSYSVIATGPQAGQPFGYGIRIPVNLSIIGSGSGGAFETRFRMLPDTSTKQNDVPQTGSGLTNGISLMGLQNNGSAGDPTGNMLMNFSLIGTHQPPTTKLMKDANGNFTILPPDPDGQGHRYNGLRLQRCIDPLIENIYVEGIPGNAAAPPGETFGINIVSGSRLVFRDIEVDGRRTRQGQTVSIGSSPIGWNNTSAAGSLVEDSYFHHCQYGMPTQYQCENIVNRRVRSEYNRTGFNNENTHMATYEDCVIKLGGLRPHHLTMMNDDRDGQLIVRNPTWDASSADATKLVIQMGPRGTGHPDLQTSPPVVTDAVGNSIMSRVNVRGN